ncbi:MAG: MFS transporter [Candidatus Paceibacterota bacterium]
MELFHFYHHHAIRNLLKDDFWLFELSIWLHVVGRSLISIFIPILMWQMGFSLIAIIGYYALLHAINIPLNFLAGSFVRRIGARWVIILSNFAIIGYFIVFDFLTSGDFVILAILALLAAVYDALYWVAHLYLFIKSNDDPQKTNGKTGALYSAKQIATMVGPIAGALILAFGSQTLLLIASIVFFFLSIVPLIYVNGFSDKPTQWDKFTSFLSYFKSPVERNNFISTGLYSIHNFAEFALWPIFIFLIFQTLESVAIIPVLIAATTIIFSLFTRRINARTREKLIMTGALALALIWIVRMTFEWGPFYYISIVLAGIFALFVSIPLDSSVFIRAKQTDPLKTAVLRNVVAMTVKLFFFGGIFLFANAFGIFTPAFIITIVSLLILSVVNLYYMTADSEEFDAILG